MSRSRGNRFRRSLWIGVAAFVGAFTTTAGVSYAALATVKSNIECDAYIFGEVSVSYDDSVQVYGGPFLTNAATKSYTIEGGMSITATATLKPKISPLKFAWLQAVIDHEGGGTFLDLQGNLLEGPWPDTTPGGYKHDRSISDNPLNPLLSTPFDHLPWYGSNKQGDLTLFDRPRNGVERDTGKNKFDFESWLVCVDDYDNATKTFTVLPLLGFTWGYQYQIDGDLDGSGAAGDKVNEYSGDTYFGGFIDAMTGPTGGFINGYAKYFNLRYLSPDDDNCRDCATPVPLPAALPMGAACLVLLAIRHRRRKTAA